MRPSKLSERRVKSLRHRRTRQLVFERFEVRQLLAGDICVFPGPDDLVDQLGWQNLTAPLDVNHDTIISSLDALLVINDLNATGPRVLDSRVPMQLWDEHEFLDVSGDGETSSLDALLVINQLNGLVEFGTSSNGGSGSGGGSASGSSSDGLCELILPLLEPRTIKFNTTFTIDLPTVDTAERPITYMTAIDGISLETRTLVSDLHLDYQPGNDNLLGFGEKWLFSDSLGTSYFVDMSGTLYAAAFQGSTLEEAGHAVARLSTAFYDEPRLLVAKSVLPVQAQFQGGHVTLVAQPGFTGDTEVTFYGTADNVHGLTTQSLRVVDNFAPVIEPISDLRMITGGFQTLDLHVSDADGDGIGLDVVVDSPAARAYSLKQNWQIQPTGSLGFFNALHANDKWFFSTIGNETFYFFILPGGEVHRSNGHNGGALTIADSSIAVVAQLDESYYADVSLILNAGPAPSIATLLGRKLTVSAVEGYGGTFDVVVTARDRTSQATQVIHVQVDLVGPIDPSIHVSPFDGNVWKLQGTTLLRNGASYLNGVSRYLVRDDGEVLSNGVLASDPPPIPFTHFRPKIRHLTAGGWKVYEGVNDFHVAPSGTIYLWGTNLEVLRNGQRTVIAENAARVTPNGETLFVLSQTGNLDRIRLDERGRVGEGVREFTLGSGQVTMLKAGGIREQMILDGDVVGMVNHILVVDDRLNVQASVPPVPVSRGVVGSTVAKVDERIVGAVGRVLVSQDIPGGYTFNGSGTILAWGGNKFVLTAAHVVESTPGHLVDRGSLRFDTRSSVIWENSAGIIVDAVYGREHFGGRDLALLRLRDSVSDVVGALLPQGVSQQGDRILIAGFGRNNNNDGGILSHGFATMDGVISNYTDSQGAILDVGPLVYNTFLEGEASADHGDSGGPDLAALTSIDRDGREFWTPVVMSVHSFLDDRPNPNNRPDIGEKTYSVVVSGDVVAQIRALIPPPILIGDLWIQVTDDGDGTLAGEGEWRMRLAINSVSQTIRRDYDGSSERPYWDRLARIPVALGGSLRIQFAGEELDSGFLDNDDSIMALDERLGVPLALLAPIWQRIGSGTGGTAYQMWIEFGYTWEA